ncbi:beta-lactamase family protein [Nocardia sp. CDC159]|uniref:Beta-lactamase family protein n=1 Tax=Nocardia pulmonis TaxID=2951408 RepID=A0A9X2EDW8_9NOCA|nr:MULTISPECIES: serine hydrolase domain-containing protein [Nocardia]MCM6779057.1 beta-lactamase family protein [Nocardia pulmonis]MCM6791947.1 beta-lactamase family protein [Nocardia sp. CDC159]
MHVDAARLSALDTYFGRLVADNKIPGWAAIVARHGEVLYTSQGGLANAAEGRPMRTDSIFKSFSLSKPITSVAFMMLVEEGLVGLNDPVAQYIPSFARSRVYRDGWVVDPITQGLVEPVRIWHLLTHTSGLGYGFHHTHPVDHLYIEAGYGWGSPEGVGLAEAVDHWAELPLRFQPGTGWNYGLSTDVLGRVIEVVSGRTLAEFLRERLFEPLGLRDTGFHVPASEKDRYAAMYTPGANGIEPVGPMSAYDTEDPILLSGGGGLYTTADDYTKFLGMLANDGRVGSGSDYLISPMTVESMRTNHLPGDVALGDFHSLWGVPAIGDAMPAAGFGLGFLTMLSPGQSHVLTRPGEYAWLSAGSANFLVDPSTGVSAIVVPQIFPSRVLPMFSRLRQFVYQSYRW